MKNIAIFGAGTMATSYVDIIESTNQYKIVGIFDDKYPNIKNCLEYPVLGTTKDLKHKCKELNINNIVVCIGDNYTRYLVIQKILKEIPNINFPTIIHKDAYVSPRSKIGKGSIIFSNVSIDANVQIGDFTFICLSSIIPHNSIIEDYSSISVGVMVGGEFELGKFSFIGIGTIAFHCVHIGQNTIVGAGSVVTKDVPSNCIAYGIPAKIIKKRKLGDKYL